MLEAKLHDGTMIDVEVHGRGPAVLLPVNPRPIEGPQADEMRKWGADPALGRSLIEGLRDAFQVVAFDYEGHVLAAPKPETLTPANVAADLLAVADAAGAERFAYYGYSWLALSGLQLAVRTDRLSALVMGGFPPLGGPYEEMLAVTTATYQMSVRNTAASPGPEEAGRSAGEAGEGGPPTSATEGAEWPAGGPDEGQELDWSAVEVSMTEPQTRQFVTLYQALREFDDRAAQTRVGCPRLCFVGSADEIAYGERWGGVHVSMAGAVTRHREELEALGWDVRVLPGLDHTGAMQAAPVLPVVRPWLTAKLGARPSA
ncbi:alpha/beta fold hydrolase [Sphaerisporangium perillae]|uniref:alpha/beta fold hydrolase n=1 Tax=Sphaerisporangium perillae TaxID=2935860 RepID=UPI00200E04C0|nr:alpha/beta hydrolase [Sphaerisporangium perillae]